MQPPENVNISGYLKNYNFDEPNAIEWDLLKQTLLELKKQSDTLIETPIYNMITD